MKHRAKNYIGTIDQTDTSITAQFGGGSFNGDLVGNTINLSGSMPEDGGTTTSTVNISVLSGIHCLAQLPGRGLMAVIVVPGRHRFPDPGRIVLTSAAIR